MLRKRPRDESDSKALARRAEPAAEATPPADKPESAKLFASLEIASGPGKGQTFQLTRMVTLIGRASTCDIVLGDQTVSREHGQLEQHQDEWVYTNLSENGSFINRKRAERMVLKSGDSIEVGAETRLKFILREPEKVDAGLLVRRRARPSREEAGVEVEEDAALQAGQVIGESFKKHRKTVIVVAIYLSLILGFIVAMSLRGGRSTSDQSQATRVYSKDEIRTVFDLNFSVTPNPNAASKVLEQAYGYYQQKDYGEGNLYRAIEAFEKSKAYQDGNFKNYKDQRTCKEAKNELTDIVSALYEAGRLAETQGRGEPRSSDHKKEADRCYDKIQKRIPDKNNRFFQHIERRRRAL